MLLSYAIVPGIREPVEGYECWRIPKMKGYLLCKVYGVEPTCQQERGLDGA